MCTITSCPLVRCKQHLLQGPRTWRLSVELPRLAPCVPGTCLNASSAAQLSGFEETVEKAQLSCALCLKGTTVTTLKALLS